VCFQMVLIWGLPLKWTKMLATAILVMIRCVDFSACPVQDVRAINWEKKCIPQDPNPSLGQEKQPKHKITKSHSHGKKIVQKDLKTMDLELSVNFFHYYSSDMDSWSLTNAPFWYSFVGGNVPNCHLDQPTCHVFRLI
jgi:hypothetical protein